MATGYLPPGWTEETLTSATPEQWDALTEEEYELVCQRKIQASLAVSAANKIVIEAEAAAQGITLPNFNLAGFVEVIRQEHLEEWGFIVIRATYEDDEEWTRFQAKWDEAIQDQLTPDHGEGIDEVKGTLNFEWIEDQEGLDGQSVDDIRGYYETWRSHARLPQGMDHALCLVVTRESLQSLLDGSTSTAHNYSNRQVAPFVLAVDTESDLEEGYNGHFKVAISALINELFPILAAQRLTPPELAPEGDGIWFSAY
ncbi:hypothetical protein BDN72DRAFT_623289 [Pluteus cervinus]|uniref:Uncharacterized protein n=1 Tax=Pluteus cervinus TaxID=181527 RepID=A0ACD3AU96_9AGAR|nr:hypothetical protein BDN72DRAFT_623289 [Pluteus cervinus]